MKKNTIESKNERLKVELSNSKKAVRALKDKLNKSKQKASELNKQLKKKDVRKVTVTKEQEQFLSNLSMMIGSEKLHSFQSALH